MKSVAFMFFLSVAAAADPVISGFGGNNPRCPSNGCKDVKPKTCCGKNAGSGGAGFQYIGCNKECDNYVPQYCRAGVCTKCPHGTFRESHLSTNRDASNCKAPITCPKGTYFPVDIYGLLDRQNLGSMSLGAYSTIPCVKCGQSGSAVEGPDVTVVVNGYYQPEGGATGTNDHESPTYSNPGKYGCAKCPSGKLADTTSCLDKDAKEIACTDTLGVTGPTKCVDCPAATPFTLADSIRDYSVTGQCRAEGPSLNSCIGTANTPSGYMKTSDTICDKICPDTQWLETKDCKATPDCSASNCKGPADGTFLSGAAPYKFECACDQKYSSETSTSCATDGDKCESKAKDAATALAANIGKTADVTTCKGSDACNSAGVAYFDNGQLISKKSAIVTAMTSKWCANAGMAAPGCKACAPGKYALASSVLGRSASGYDKDNSRYTYSVEGNDNPPSCMDCPNGMFSGWAAGACSEDCPAGFELQDKKCTACGPGKFAPGANTPMCTDCPEGQFSGQASDDNAPGLKDPETSMGYSGDQGYMTGRGGPGRWFENVYNVSGASRCGVCYHKAPSEGKGFAGFRTVQKMESTGVTNCSLCPFGKYAQYEKSLANDKITGLPGESDGEPKSWRWGVWNQATDPILISGSAVCTACGAGKFSNASTAFTGAREDQQCLFCPPLDVPNAEQTHCVQCPPGSGPSPRGVFPYLENLFGAFAYECQSFVTSYALFCLHLLMAILVMPLMAMYGDRKCCKACVKAGFANFATRLVWLLWVLAGVISALISMPILDRVVCFLLPFCWLCCCSVSLTTCVEFNKLENERLAGHEKSSQVAEMS